jgi:phage terminase large subunit-like protein
VARYAIDQKFIEGLSAAERQELAPYIAAYQAHLEANPLLNFQPHPKQSLFLASTVPLKAFLGGNRSGKTTCGIVDDLIQACSPEDLPEHLLGFKKWQPPFFCRIVAPDFVSTMEGVIFNKLREWCPRNAMEGGSWDKAYDKQRRMLWFSNGSWMQFLTFEQDLDKHSGAALHRVHFDEEPPSDIRRECLMRLIDFGGDELFTMTPLFGMSWMFDSIYEPYVKGDLDDAIVVEVDMDDNPHLDEVTKKRALAGLSEEERNARKSGRFVHFGGMVFGEFSGNHVVDQFPYDYFTPGHPGEFDMIYVGIDPGTRHLAAAVFVACTPDGQLIVFDEVGIKDGTVRDMAGEIALLRAKWSITPRMYVIDPAARNRNHQTGRSDQMEYMDAGIVAVPGQNAVTAGIQNIKARLQASPPQLRVTENCAGLIDEFHKYRWTKQKRNADGADPKEEPLKTNDHRLDALRYVAMARPYAPAVVTDERNESIYQRMIREDLERSRRPARVARGAAQFGPGVWA